jgi:citrate synthase
VLVLLTHSVDEVTGAQTLVEGLGKLLSGTVQGTTPYASKFLEMVLMLTADHGPAVSGAMNTIITTRAGKDYA